MNGDKEMQAGGYGAPEGELKSAGDSPGNAQGDGQQQITSPPTNIALPGIAPAQTQPSSQGQPQQGQQQGQQAQGQQAQWQGQAQQQAASGQQQAAGQPQRQPVCEMIMHPINNSEHHHYPPEGPPEGEQAGGCPPPCLYGLGDQTLLVKHAHLHFECH